MNERWAAICLYFHWSIIQTTLASIIQRGRCQIGFYQRGHYSRIGEDIIGIRDVSIGYYQRGHYSRIGEGVIGIRDVSIQVGYKEGDLWHYGVNHFFSPLQDIPYLWYKAVSQHVRQMNFSPWSLFSPPPPPLGSKVRRLPRLRKTKWKTTMPTSWR